MKTISQLGQIFYHIYLVYKNKKGYHQSIKHEVQAFYSGLIAFTAHEFTHEHLSANSFKMHTICMTNRNSRNTNILMITKCAAICMHNLAEDTGGICFK